LSRKYPEWYIRGKPYMEIPLLQQYGSIG